MFNTNPSQEEQRRVSEESGNSLSTLTDQQQESSTHPRNWNHKEAPQLPPVNIVHILVSS